MDPQVASCKGKFYAILAFVFVVGLVAGGLTEHLFERRPRNLALGIAEKDASLQHLSEELALSPEQARTIEGILDECIMQQADLLSQFRKNRANINDKILQVLNDDQRQRYRKVIAELGTKRKE